MNQDLSADLNLFYPRKDCSYWQSLENKIIKDGVYVTKSDLQPRQMFKCCGGNHRFSETNYSGLFRKQGSFKEYEHDIIRIGTTPRILTDTP